jgi:hypothetical protein
MRIKGREREKSLSNMCREAYVALYGRGHYQAVKEREW